MTGTDDAGPPVTCTRCQAEIPAGAAFCPSCGTSREPGAAAVPMLPGFHVERTLGHGGAAVVYLATQESLDRHVAVKVLRRHVDEDDKMWRRFRREARTIAKLSGHPNVVNVYTAGLSDTGVPYLVTEYLDRGSLADVIIAEGPLPPSTVAELGVAVADALSAAHALGILHRDVKPGNVLLGHDGRVKLGDFGIARLLAGQSATTTDVMAFTPEHVAPEVLRGEPDAEWSDVYGLASTLATALSGTSPFERRPEERVEAMLSRKLMAPPPPLPSSVPHDLKAPITQALDPDPGRRPTLAELRRQLAAASIAHGAAAPPPPALPAAAAIAADGSRQPPGLPPPVSGDDERSPAARGGNGLRRRGPWWAIPAVVLLLFVGVLALVAALAGGGDADEDAGDATGRTAGAPAVPTGRPARTSRPPVTTASPVTAPPTASPETAAPDTPPQTTTPTTTAPTTAAPTTAAPTTAAPTTAGETDAVLTQQDADAYVRSYYDGVAAGNYEASWAQLAPEFQTGTAVSFDYYSNFWDQNDIEVGTVELVEANADGAVVDVDLRWNDESDFETNRFTLRREGERLLIADQRVV